jgi:hypothetical protein
MVVNRTTTSRDQTPSCFRHEQTSLWQLPTCASTASVPSNKSIVTSRARSQDQALIGEPLKVAAAQSVDPEDCFAFKPLEVSGFLFQTVAASFRGAAEGLTSTR